MGSLGNLARLINLFNGLDDTDSDSLTHITDGETTKRRIFSVSFNTHGLGRNQLDNGGITRLDELLYPKTNKIALIKPILLL